MRLRKARLGGFIPAKHEIVTPWVRLERVEDFLRGHCVGAELIGAHFPISPEEDAALVALGWHHPTPAEGRTTCGSGPTTCRRDRTFHARRPSGPRPWWPPPSARCSPPTPGLPTVEPG